MTTSLNNLLTDLLNDPAARLSLNSDPDGYLEGHGWSGLDADELDEALSQLVDSLPVSDAVALDEARLDLPAGESEVGVDQLLGTVLDSYDTAIETQTDGYGDLSAQLFDEHSPAEPELTTELDEFENFENGEPGADAGVEDTDVGGGPDDNPLDDPLHDGPRSSATSDEPGDSRELDELDVADLVPGDDLALELDENVSYGQAEPSVLRTDESFDGPDDEFADGFDDGGLDAIGDDVADFTTGHAETSFEPTETDADIDVDADGAEFAEQAEFAHPDQANADDPFDLLD